jgi:hypothetical protein
MHKRKQIKIQSREERENFETYRLRNRLFDLWDDEVNTAENFYSTTSTFYLNVLLMYKFHQL